MQIELSPDGDFRLTYPSGVSVDVPNSPHAVGYLYKLLFSANEAKAANRRPHYPSAKEVAAYMKAQARERKEQVFKDYGVDVNSLVINI